MTVRPWHRSAVLTRLLVSLTFISSFAPLATAQVAEAPRDPPGLVEAREHLNNGSRLIENNDYNGALVELRRAYELVPSDHPARFQILFNIARAYELQQEYGAAVDNYQRYLDEGGPQAAQRAEVEATMRVLQRLIAIVTIASNVPATVWVDGRESGRAPGEVRLSVGRHSVELRASGYGAEQQELTLAAGDTQTLTFELSEYGGGITPIIFWVSTGIAVAAGLAGGGIGIAAILRRSNVDAQLADPVEMLDGGALEDARSEIETLQIAADIMFGTAGLFAVASIIVAFLTDWGGDDEALGDVAAAEIQFRPLVSPDYFGLGAAGSF